MLYYTEDKTVEDMPVNPETLEERYKRKNWPIYKDFCSFFVSGVVGIRHFDRNKCQKQLSKYVTISDEAFAVLTLENNWSRWSCMAKRDEWKDSDVPSKWTTSRDKRKHTKQGGDDSSCDEDSTPQARRYRGWSAKGIARYNQLFKEIKLEREKDEYEEFETYCMEDFQEEAQEQGKQGRKRKVIGTDIPLPVAEHELWDKENNQEVQNEEVSLQMPQGLSQLVGV
jgi:hypothetical protein